MKDDLLQINSLLKQLSEKPKLIIRKDFEKIIKQENIRIIVIRNFLLNYKIIGMGIIYFVRTFTTNFACIGDVVIDKNYRGLGIGKKIVKRLIELAREKKVDCVCLTSNPKRIEANALYQKLGFKKDEQKTNRYILTLKKPR